jgi:hypothetical protein
VQRLLQRPVDVPAPALRAVDRHRRKQPGSAALAATACEIGTASQPGMPKGAERRCRGRWRPAPGGAQLAEVVAAAGLAQQAAHLGLDRRVVNSPVGSARPSRSERRQQVWPPIAARQATCSASPGSAAARRANSPRPGA